MIQISLPTVKTASAAPRNAPVKAGEAGDFAIALGTMLAGAASAAGAEKGDAPPADAPPPVTDARQLLALDGKKLPVLPETGKDETGAEDGEAASDTSDDKDSDKQPDGADPAFAWFGGQLASDPVRAGFSQANLTASAGKPAARTITLGSSPLPTLHLPTTPMDGQKLPAGDTAAQPQGQTQAATTPAAPADGGAMAAATATPTADTAVTTTPTPGGVPIPTGFTLTNPAPTVGTSQLQPEQQVRGDTTGRGTEAQPVATPLVDVSLSPPVLASRPNLTAASAAAAAAAATFAPAGSSSSQSERPNASRTIDGTTFTPTAPDAAQAPAVAAPADLQQGTLDTRRQEWMGRMIDHIESMRDASASGNDTRIRLAPDALGRVDISIRHEAGSVHVHFATETQAASQLLSDAQPRLNELAEARGIKLGQTTVGNGSADAGTGQGQQQQAAARATPNLRPASVLSGAETDADSDQRIA